MKDLVRQEIVTGADTIVVKVGTRTVTRPSGALDDQQITHLAEQLCEIRRGGRQVVLVSSGAVGAGISELALAKRPTDVAQLQAVAAVGQTKLIEAYDRTMRQFGYHAAQVLLTADDLNERARYLNVRNTLHSLLRMETIPIINENDTVAVDELMVTFGDNDRLAALVTNLIRAPLLIILSDVDGLFDGAPDSPHSRVISTVSRLDETIESYVCDSRSGPGRGGMASKLRAAGMVTAAGENAVVANGHRPNVLRDILAGDVVGTLFLAQGKTISPWKRWIGFSAHLRGRVFLDEGACQAVTRRGSSLLAIGITATEGSFQKGDVVALCDAKGREIARGLTNYSSEQLDRIKGMKSDRIGEILGHRPYEEVVHRDNLVLRETM